MVCYRSDIPYETARRAYMGTSFTPEKRADTTRTGYHEHLVHILETFTQAAASVGVAQEHAEHEFNRYREGYKVRYLAMLHARSNCISFMITGPAKFPVRRQEKANRSVDNRVEELMQFEKRATQAALRNINSHVPPEQLHDNETRRLLNASREIIGIMKRIEQGEPWSAPLMKSNYTGKLERSLANGNIESVKAAVAYVEREQAAQLKKSVITPRHKLYKLIAAAEQQAALPEEPKETWTVCAYDGATIYGNPADDRVQIIMDEKPSEAVRNDLKRQGWRWSPRNTAWQRQLTRNAIESARAIISAHYQAADDDQIAC